MITIQSACVCQAVANSSAGWILWNASIRYVKADSFPIQSNFDCFVSCQRIHEDEYQQEQVEVGIAVYKRGTEDVIFANTQYGIFPKGGKYLTACTKITPIFPEAGDYDIVFRAGTDEEIDSIKYGITVE